VAGTYTYTFLAKDLMSSKLSQIGNKGKSTFTTINQKVDNMTVNIQRADRASQKINSTWNRTLGLATRLGLAFSFGQVVGSVINLGAEMEQTRISFETMLGSADKANKVINDLNQFSNKTPFKNKEVLTAGRNLLAFGIAQEKVLPTMRAIGDVSSGLKIPFNELSEIYGKIKVQNTVFSEDLNQLAGRGIPIFDELAKVMGVAPENIKKLASQGKITFPFIEQAFNNMSGEGGKFFNLMEKQSQSFGGKWSTFLGKLQLGATKLGEKALPYLSKFVDWGIATLDFLPLIPAYIDGMYNSLMSNSSIFQFLVNNIEGIKTGVLALGAAWLTYKTYMTIVSTATKIYTGIQWLLNGAMLANPVGLIVAGIAALAAGFAYAYNRIGWFRGGINAAWEVLKGFGTAMKELVVDRFKEMLAGLSSLGEAFLHFFKGDWQKAWDAGKKGVQGLTGYGGDAIKNFQANARVTGKKAAEAFGKGMDEAAANKKSGSIMDLIKNKVGLGSSAGTSDGATGSPAGTGPLGDSLKDGINAINGGGARQTNITVTFDKLVENFTISSQNIQQGIAQSEEELKRMLLRVLNSTNQMQTSPT
jgi:tape measure domain-containing protein